jgi:flagellar motor switch/type III secretory pathway protein FliN
MPEHHTPALTNADRAVLTAADKAALTGADKAALVLLSLPPDERSRLVSTFSADEAARLSQGLARLSGMDSHARRVALGEFHRALARPPDQGPPEDTFCARETRAASVEASLPVSGAVRALDLSALKRVRAGAARLSLAEDTPDLAAFGDLPVRCRVELAALTLPVAALSEVDVGDVLLLKPRSEAVAELVGGEACRLRGRPGSENGGRTFEILAAPSEETR